MSPNLYKKYAHKEIKLNFENIQQPTSCRCILHVVIIPLLSAHTTELGFEGQGRATDLKRN